MASSLPKNLPFDRATVIEEVTRGYKLTSQLQSLLLQQPQPPQGDRGSELARVLVEDVLQALTTSLSILNSVAADIDGGSPELGSGSTIDHGIERSGEKVMLSAARHRNQRRRGKESDHLQQRTHITSAHHYDGYQWRKYGNKKIGKSENRRAYYRCTHNDGQSCPAIKQVVQQKDSKDFLVTYIDNHTCRNTTTTTTTNPQLLSVDPTSPSTDLQPFSITVGSNTKSALLIGHMDNWHPATWPSTNHPVPTRGSQPSTTTTTTPQLSVDPNLPTTGLILPLSITFGISNTEPALSGQMDSRQPAACPSSNHRVPHDEPTHESMGVDHEPLTFTLDEVGGGGDVALLSGPLMSPTSPGLDIMDYLLMDSSELELNDLESFMAEEVGGGGDVDRLSGPLMSPITNYYNELESLLNS